MTEYFDRIEAHLLDAVQRQADSRTSGLGGFRRSRTRAARRAARWALAAASVVVAVLVFLGALLITGGGTGRRSAAPTGASPSRVQLIGLLGVLREPQTAAGRAFDHGGWPTPPHAPGSRIEPDRSLIRLATVTQWGAKVFIVPLTKPTNAALARSLGETVALWVQGIGWSDYSRAVDLEAGQAWGPGRTVRGRHGLESRFFEIVPDGVAKVVFYPAPRFSRAGAAAQLSRSITATVHNNVAVFQVSVATAGAYPVDAAWYGVGGRLIKRIGSNLAAGLGRSFPLAPRTQPGGWSDRPGPCPLAPPNPYLPRRAGCVSTAIAGINGQPALFLLYARLGNRRLDGEFVPTAFTLKVIRAGASTFTLAALPHPLVSPEIILVRNVNEQPGTEIFVHDGHLSSGESLSVYTFDGRELREAGSFAYGGDSALQAGLTCHSGQKPTITQHQFLLETGGANALWQQTDIRFTWNGPRLERTSQHTSRRRGTVDIGGLGFPPRSLTDISC